MWTWRILGPACFLQAQDEPSNREASTVMHLIVYSGILEVAEGKGRNGFFKKVW